MTMPSAIGGGNRENKDQIINPLVSSTHNGFRRPMAAKPLFENPTSLECEMESTGLA
jgi:hypothetical protein